MTRSILLFLEVFATQPPLPVPLWELLQFPFVQLDARHMQERERIHVCGMRYCFWVWSQAVEYSICELALLRQHAVDGRLKIRNEVEDHPEAPARGSSPALPKPAWQKCLKPMKNRGFVLLFY